MFEDVLDYTKELERTAESTHSFLNKLRGGRRRLINKIQKAKEQTALMKNVDKYVESIMPAIQKEVAKNAKDVLQGAMLEAVRDNHEFDWPTYRRALFLAAADEDTYKVYNLGGSGWNKRLTFTINLDASAGRLEAWARGVKAYRKDLKVKVPRKGSKKREISALSASRAWGGIFGSRSANNTFQKTIRARLNYSGATAPFWQLLDKGVVPMSSDRGGFPTPRGEPTNFVHEAQQTMEEFMRNLLKNERNLYEKLFVDYNRFLNEAEVQLDRLNDMVDKIKLDLQVINRLESEFRDVLKYIDSTKLEKAVQLIREGLLTTGRVELTARGSRKRVRPSVSKIAGLLY